jgi:hypothetical protein
MDDMTGRERDGDGGGEQSSNAHSGYYENVRCAASSLVLCIARESKRNMHRAHLVASCDMFKICSAPCAPAVVESSGVRDTCVCLLR